MTSYLSILEAKSTRVEFSPSVVLVAVEVVEVVEVEADALLSLPCSCAKAVVVELEGGSVVDRRINNNKAAADVNPTFTYDFFRALLGYSILLYSFVIISITLFVGLLQCEYLFM